jgi:hypothetical protein
MSNNIHTTLSYYGHILFALSTAKLHEYEVVLNKILFYVRIKLARSSN